MIADNLDSQDATRNPPYISALDKNQTDDHKVPAGKTDQVTLTSHLSPSSHRRHPSHLTPHTSPLTSHHSPSPSPFTLTLILTLTLTQVQPVDDGLGQHVKIYIGQEENDWLEDDDNLRRWENNELTASDRRILLATWYCRALKRALEGHAKRKYFEHTGALLTADGTGDDLIKLEGMPKGHKFTWVDDEMPMVTAPPASLGEHELTPEPADTAPERLYATARAEVDEEGDGILDDEDDEDEDDEPPALCTAPEGFYILDSPPSAEQLAFSKDPSPGERSAT